MPSIPLDSKKSGNSPAHQARTFGLVKSGKTVGPGQTRPTYAWPSGFVSHAFSFVPASYTKYPVFFLIPGSIIATVWKPITFKSVISFLGLGNHFELQVKQR